MTINNHSITVTDGLDTSGAPQLLLNQDNGSNQHFTQANVNTNFFNLSTFVNQTINVQLFDPLGLIPISILQPYSISTIGLKFRVAGILFLTITSPSNLPRVFLLIMKTMPTAPSR